MDNSVSTAGDPLAVPHSWGPAPLLSWISGALGAAALVWFVFDRDSENRLVAAALVVVAGLVAASLAVVRRRVTATPVGLRVREVFGSRTIPWSGIRSISATAGGRLGNPRLEVDLDDDALLIFSRLELGEDPEAVARVLQHWWAARR